MLTITCFVFLFQFNAHFLHLYNLASAGESQKRQIDDLKGKLVLVEGRISTLEHDYNAKTVGLQSAEATSDRLAAEVKVLKTWLRKSNDRLKAPKEKSLEHEKKAQELGSARDEALAQALSLKEEVDFLKSATHRESFLAHFRGSEVYTAEVESQAASYLNKGAIHMVC